MCQVLGSADKLWARVAIYVRHQLRTDNLQNFGTASITRTFHEFSAAVKSVTY